ncbi:MAG: Xaa-Pro peptidase family protein [Deltaproteobacteria bacterium]|nr:Xaa-Pro peptidase family protein [Deltaproteobacteria bacterium]
MPSIPFSEIDRRIKLFQTALMKKGLDAALIVHRVDLYYLSGTAQDAHLFVPAAGAPMLLVRRSFERAREDSPLELVAPLKSLSKIRDLIGSAFTGRFSSLGMELDVLPVNNFHQYQALFPNAGIHDVSPLIRETRMIKSDYELNLMRRAAELNDSMFNSVQDILKEGMTEVEFAGLLESFYRSRGHQGLVRVRSFNNEVFYGHIMSGTNLAIPSCSVGPTGGPGPNASMPQGAGLKRINAGEPISIDYVGIVEGYMVDQARTFFIGEAPEEFLRIHSLALEIQDAVAGNGKSGASAEKLYDMAIEMAASVGPSVSFMGYPSPVPFIGHGVGLELDELPVLGKKSRHVLKEGMAIAIEPKFIIPGKGLAGIENTFVVGNDGMEKLTNFGDEIHVLNW